MKPFDYAKHRVKKVRESSFIKDAARIFEQENIGSVVVVDSGGEYMGLLTDKVLYKAIADGVDMHNLRVKELSLEDLVLVDKDADLDEVNEEFGRSQSGRIAMVDRYGRVVGILKRKNIERFSDLRIAKSLLRR